MHSSPSTEAASGLLSRRKTQTWSCKPEDDQSDFWFNKKKLHLNLTVKRESSEVHGASNVVIQSGRIADHTWVVQPDDHKLRSSDKLFGKNGLFFQPPQKVMQQFFLGCRGLYFGPTNTIYAKIYQKFTFGVLFSLPPQNALQCTTVQCNVL